MRRVAAALVAAALWLAAAAPAQEAPGAAPDVPAGDARIAGIVRAAEGGTPVPDVEVVLYSLRTSGEAGLRTTTSDAAGRFAFEAIAGDPETVYIVGARFRGVPHPGDRVVFEPEQRSAEVVVEVSELTQDPAAVEVREARLRLDPLGPELRVVERLAFENPTRRTFHVPPAQRDEARPAFETRLPAGATDFQMPLGYVPEGVERRGDLLRFWGPVHPGPGEILWSYALALEAQAEDAAVELATRLPAGTRVEVLVPEEAGAVRVPGLEEGEPTSVDGRPYRVFAGRPEDGEVALALALPPARVDTEAFDRVELRWVLHMDDAAVDVSERHLFRTEGDERVSAPPGEALARIPLPAEASGLRFGTSAPGLVLAPHPEGGLAVSGTAPPGEATVEVAYRLPVRGQPVELSRRFAERVPLFSVFLADSGHWEVASERLHRRRPVRTSDLTYMHLEAFEVEAGETVGLRVGTRAAGGLLPRSAVLALTALLALGVTALLVGPLWSARARRAPVAEEESPAQRERQAIYASIRDLEHDFETGKVSAEDHDRLRDELRSRAVALLRAERAAQRVAAPAERAQAPEAAAAGCPRCDAAPRPGDRFCARCGATLARAGREAGA